MIIGLVGEKGGGKETFTKALRATCPGKNLIQMRFGDILKALELPLTRENMQRLPIVINQFLGEGTITRAMKMRLEKASADIVILDGVRLPTDYQMLAELPESFLVYITAKPEIRYERIRKRAEKVGESDLTFERFLEQEKAEIEKYIPEIGEKADFKIENNGSLEDFKKQIGSFFQQFLTK